jgi:predicted O-methyltransferase YrrM
VQPLAGEILRTQTVHSVDGNTTFPLKDAIDAEIGLLLQRLIEQKRPSTTLEIGLAYGVSGLFICEALEKVGGQKHIAIDAFQSTTWSGVGIHNLRQAGFAHLVELREQLSQDALPQLVNEGVRVDFAFIDGSHAFDQKMVDFFFVDRLLNVGGIMAFDDCDWASVHQVCRFIAINSAYRVCGTTHGTPPGFRGRVIRSAARHSKSVRSIVKPKFILPDEDFGMLPDCRCIAFEKMANEHVTVWPDSGHREF